MTIYPVSKQKLCCKWKPHLFPSFYHVIGKYTESLDIRDPTILDCFKQSNIMTDNTNNNNYKEAMGVGKFWDTPFSHSHRIRIAVKRLFQLRLSGDSCSIYLMKVDLLSLTSVCY